MLLSLASSEGFLTQLCSYLEVYSYYSGFIYSLLLQKTTQLSYLQVIYPEMWVECLKGVNLWGVEGMLKRENRCRLFFTIPVGHTEQS